MNKKLVTTTCEYIILCIVTSKKFNLFLIILFGFCTFLKVIKVLLKVIKFLFMERKLW